MTLTVILKKESERQLSQFLIQCCTTVLFLSKDVLKDPVQRLTLKGPQRKCRKLVIELKKLFANALNKQPQLEMVQQLSISKPKLFCFELVRNEPTKVEEYAEC